MAGNGSAKRLGRRTWIALVVAVLALVFLSPAFGRADPRAGFRPVLPPDALTNGCYPLPSGLRLTFPYQVRLDGDVTAADGTPGRELVLQYDLRDADEVEQALVADFHRAGFRSVGVPASNGVLTFTRADTGTVGAQVLPLSVPYDAGIVRGSISLSLPRVAVQSDSPVCSDPNSTKRFPPGSPTLGTLP